MRYSGVGETLTAADREAPFRLVAGSETVSKPTRLALTIEQDGTGTTFVETDPDGGVVDMLRLSADERDMIAACCIGMWCTGMLLLAVGGAA